MSVSDQERDFTSIELTLVRAGHYVWALYRRESASKGGYPSEEGPLWEALQIIWNAKKAYRADLKIKRLAESNKLRKKFKRVA